MVKFINRLTGTEMLVADERAEEYKEAGHKLASEILNSKSPASESESESESTSEASSETAKTQKNKGSKNTRSKAE